MGREINRSLRSSWIALSNIEPYSIIVNPIWSHRITRRIYDEPLPQRKVRASGSPDFPLLST